VLSCTLAAADVAGGSASSSDPTIIASVNRRSTVDRINPPGAARRGALGMSYHLSNDDPVQVGRARHVASRDPDGSGTRDTVAGRSRPNLPYQRALWQTRPVKTSQSRTTRLPLTP
jgi:hypothetical protein